MSAACAELRFAMELLTADGKLRFETGDLLIVAPLLGPEGREQLGAVKAPASAGRPETRDEPLVSPATECLARDPKQKSVELYNPAKGPLF